MQPQAPSAQNQFNIADVITVTARLAQLLAEEADMLASMKLKKVEALQHEKIFLTNALEANRRLVDKNPHLMETIPSQDKHDLQKVVDIFNDILEENHRKLMLAREVNGKIVSAIKEVAREHSMSKVYSSGGATYIAPYESVSVTLDKVI